MWSAVRDTTAVKGKDLLVSHRDFLSERASVNSSPRRSTSRRAAISGFVTSSSTHFRLLLMGSSMASTREMAGKKNRLATYRAEGY